MKRFVLTCMMGILSMSASYGTSLFSPKTFKLDNGLSVIFVKNSLSPAVSIALGYKVGTADDPANMVGLSHFLEHMMFKGTKKVPENGYTKKILSVGGRTNAFTSFDYTVYVTDIAARYLEMVLELEADRMENLGFSPQDIISEQKVVMEERLMRMDNNPFGVAMEASLRASFWHHPYGVPPIGYPHHIQAYTFDAMMSHYHKWYAVNNAVLIVSGNIEFEDLKQMILRQFSHLTPKELPTRFRPKEPDHQGVSETIEQYGGRLRNTILSYSYEAPNFTQDVSVLKKEDFFVLQVLGELLAGSENSKLYDRLVEKKNLALSVSFSYADSSLDPQPFSLTIVLAPNVSFEMIEKEIKEELELLLKEGIKQEDVDQSIRDLNASLFFSLDGTSGAMMSLVPVLVGIPLETLDAWPENFTDIKADKVKLVLEKLLSKPPLVKLKLSPQLPVHKEGAFSNVGLVETVKNLFK